MAMITLTVKVKQHEILGHHNPSCIWFQQLVILDHIVFVLLRINYWKCPEIGFNGLTFSTKLQVMIKVPKMHFKFGDPRYGFWYIWPEDGPIPSSRVMVTLNMMKVKLNLAHFKYGPVTRSLTSGQTQLSTHSHTHIHTQVMTITKG